MNIDANEYKLNKTILQSRENKRLEEISIDFNNGSIASEQTQYNFSNAILENGAMLYNDLVILLGGPNDGSATVQVYVNQKGSYEINLKFLGANSFFKIDVNGVSTNTTYETPNQNNGNLLEVIDLNAGYNDIKFHGDSIHYGPNFSQFSLTLFKAASDYNLINGRVSGSARIDRSKNMVVALGGANKGEVNLDVVVYEAGYYRVSINFNMGSRPFLIDVGGLSTGEVYIVQAGFSGKYDFEIALNNGKNTLRFYGLGSELAPNLGEFTLDFINELTTLPDKYSVAKGVLKNGARINNTKTLAVNLGGARNGSSTVVVNVQESGKYNIEIEYRGSSKPIKIDVNQQTVNDNLITPAGDYGVFTNVIELNQGDNEIKFYGVNSEYGAYLGNFTLSYINQNKTPVLPPGIYDVKDGAFENGAQIETSGNFVSNIGGPRDGSVTVDVNVKEEGEYRIQIEYLSDDPSKKLMLTVNGVNVGIYNVNVTNSLSFKDMQFLRTNINLNSGDNTIKFHGDLVSYGPILRMFILSKNGSVGKKYTFDELNKLTYPELVKILKTIKYNDINGIFEFSNDSNIFYNDDNRVQAIIDELGKSGQSFTDSDEKGIDTLVEVLRSGFYLAFYNTQLSKLEDISYRDKCIPAIKLTINNKNFKLGTSTQNGVINSIGKLIGNASVDVKIINKLSDILIDFGNNLSNYSDDQVKANAVYKILNEINVFLNREKVRNSDATKTQFYGNIDPFLVQVESLTQKGINFAASSDWLVNNFIFYAAMFSDFRRDNKITHKVLSDCLNIYPDLSSHYLEVLKRLETKFNGVLANGNVIDIDKEKNRAKAKYLPNEYKFDDDTMLIKTGDRVTVDKVKRLYWASKEVKAQFLRIANNDEPIEIGNADDRLTMVIYNSPIEYKLNSLIYGYSTENGGIYIEKIGTFFTYERRTPEDSIYSLEELFRHEYVHYLEGRYLVKGLWGVSDFYTGGSLIWFAEGIGEFFAGATRKSNVQPRKSLVDSLVTSRKKLSAEEVLNAKYGSYDFYKYAFAFIYYMYTKQLNQFLEIVRLLKADDVNAYDNYISMLKKDNSTNTLYDETLNELINNVSNYLVPAVSDDYLVNYSDVTTNDILKDILSETNISVPSISIQESDFYKTFTVKGAYDNGISIDEITDWQSMNRKLNEILDKLDNKSWGGYKTINAYFTKYRVDANRRATFDLVFFGVYKSK